MHHDDQAWEQIEHRHTERRLLVAEACGTLAPYIPDAMRGSLVLSILTQMMEDKVEEVRDAVVRSLGILSAFIDDPDKYASATQLLFSTLNDSSDRVRVGGMGSRGQMDTGGRGDDSIN